MNPQEQQMLSELLDRFTRQPVQAKDADAEAMINRVLAVRPDLPYMLAQTVLIQELALADAKRRIEEAEQKASQVPQRTSFLGGLFGGDRSSVPQTGAGPWRHAGAQPEARPTPGRVLPQSSGFLQNAAATAAGVVGGMLLFDGIRSMFGSATAADIAQQAGLESLPGSAHDLAQPDQGAAQDADAIDADFGDDDSFGGDDI